MATDYRKNKRVTAQLIGIKVGDVDVTTIGVKIGDINDSPTVNLSSDQGQTKSSVLPTFDAKGNITPNLEPISLKTLNDGTRSLSTDKLNTDQFEQDSYVVASGQDLFDILIQRNGKIDGLFDDLLDFNEDNLSVNTELKTNDQLYVNTKQTGDFTTKNFIKNINFVVVNNDETQDVAPKGDFNSDFNNDYF